MSAPISIAIALNTSEVASGARKASDAIEDVSDSLDAMARDGDKAGEKLERSLEEAQRETEQTERSFKELGRAADRSLDDVGTSAKRNFGKAGESAREFKGEAIANLSEVTSSFDGSIQGVADGIQGTLGGAVLGLSAISIPAALGLAGLGALAGTFFNQWSESAEQTEQRISDMYQDMLESGKNYLSQDFINQQLATLYEDQDKYNQAVKTATELHLPLQTVLIAEVTAGKERNEVLAAADKLRRDALESVKAGASYTDQEAAAAARTADSAADIVEHYQSLNGEQSDALSKAGAIKAAQDQVNESFKDGERASYKTLQNIQGMASFKVNVPVTVQTPDMGSVFSGLQSQANKGKILIPAAIKTKYGVIQ